jgi:hypothetical protein
MERRGTIVEAYRQHRVCAVIFERIIASHNRIHGVMEEMGTVMDEPRKHSRSPNLLPGSSSLFTIIPSANFETSERLWARESAP